MGLNGPPGSRFRSPSIPKSAEFQTVYRHDGEAFYGVKEDSPLVVDLSEQNVTARIVRLQVPGRCSFALDEVEVYGQDDPEENIALNRPADQKSIGPYSVPGTKGHEYTPPEPTEPEHVEFQLAHTRDVVERGRQLAARLQRKRFAGNVSHPW